MSKIQLITPDEDSPLLLAWHHGDLSAFETLVWKYRKRIFNLAILLTGDKESAGQATENSFVTAFREIRSLTGKSHFSTWLIAIALKECRDLNSFRSAETAPTQIHAAAGLQAIIDSDKSSATMKKLASCLRDLPVELIEVVLLRYVRGYSIEKLEEIFLIRSDTLLSRLFEAEETLTSCLKNGLKRSSDMATPHPEIRRNFSAYLDTSAVDGEKVATKEHLKSCGSCREALADLEWIIEHLKSLPDEDPPPSLTTSVMERVRNMPEKPAEVRKHPRITFKVTAGMLLLAIIWVSAYFLTRNEKISAPKPAGEASRIGNRTPASAEEKKTKSEDLTSILKGAFRGADLQEAKTPKTLAAPPSSPASSHQGSPPTAMPSLISPPARTEAPSRTDAAQHRERAEKPQLPSEWGDIQTPGRTLQKKTPAPGHGSGEIAVVLTVPDSLAATREIENAVTSLGGSITGRAYSSGKDILYTRIEVVKLIDLMGRLGKIGRISELPELPDGAEGAIDLVIRW
jgi:RNA polymerase sigma-70 factor (ECF subfamily)